MRCRILCVLLAGCAATASRRDAPFSEGELVDLMVTWREGERRRDPEMAGRALQFARSSDRRWFEDDLEYLKGVPAGPIRAPMEFRLVSGPDGRREGDYLFLEPLGRAYAATMVTVVRVRGRPRILYERPDLTEEERASRRPEEIVRLAAARRIEHWQSLDRRDLDREVARLKRMLRYQSEAQAYAEREELPMPPFSPDPATILADLEGRDAAGARDRVIALLGGA